MAGLADLNRRFVGWASVFLLAHRYCQFPRGQTIEPFAHPARLEGVAIQQSPGLAVAGLGIFFAGVLLQGRHRQFGRAVAVGVRLHGQGQRAVQVFWFPRAAWESSLSALRTAWRSAPLRRSHAARGNERTRQSPHNRLPPSQSRQSPAQSHRILHRQFLRREQPLGQPQADIARQLQRQMRVAEHAVE